jgi:hypothetical protein
VLGIRKHVLKDSNDTIPSARRKLQKWVLQNSIYCFINCTIFHSSCFHNSDFPSYHFLLLYVVAVIVQISLNLYCSYFTSF